VVYTAKVTLTAKPNYTFTGVDADDFFHTDAAAINNLADSGVITIRFPSCGFPTSPSTDISFGPVTAADSALKLMNDKKNESNLSVDLSANDIGELVVPVVLEAGINSPAQVVINGNGRVLNLQGTGTLITVATGVTLILQDITLAGDNNDAPLVEIRTGGKLILGSGVTLRENQNITGDAGGVWVNGGELIMNAGAEIKDMVAKLGGGVLVSNNGVFNMIDGTIQENAASDNYSGGGVLVDGGSFIMSDGAIKANTNTFAPLDATLHYTGGGVFVANGEFIMKAGSIQDNTGYGAGGVGLINNSAGKNGTFTMHNGSIQGNTSNTNSSSSAYGYGPYGGGVLNFKSTFIMNNGNIKENSFKGTSSYNSNGGGGGVYNHEGIFIMNYGSIEGNTVSISGGGGVATNKPLAGGVYNTGTFTMNGGTISGDNKIEAGGSTASANGVYTGEGSASFSMLGGTITGNNTGTYNYGVSFASGVFTMKGSARVTADNLVLLATNRRITIGGNLTAASPVANIKCQTPPNSGTGLLQASLANLIDKNYTKFYYEGQSGHIGSDGKYVP
jgi:hypothetical protein